MQGGKGKDSAESKQNYDVLGSPPSGINVINAVLEADGQTVTLTLNKNLIAGNTYTLKISDVQSSDGVRSEEHTSELQSLMRISYAVFCLKKKKNIQQHTRYSNTKNINHNTNN